MLTVDDYARIRRAHRDGMSLTAIAKKFGHSWRKVRQVVDEAEPRPYTRRKPPRAPKLGEFHARIDEILEDDQQQPRKQRHTAKQIFRRLVEEGYQGGYDHCRNKRCWNSHAVSGSMAARTAASWANPEQVKLTFQ